MHLPSSTALPVTLLSLLLGSSSMASAISDRSTCVRQNAPILAEAAACGGQHSLQECFLAVPDFVTLDDLQGCFVDAGCTIAEATSEATIILQNCDASVSVPELRPRNPDAIPETSPTPTPTPTPTPKDNNNSSSRSITTSGIAVTILLALVVVIVVVTLLFFYAKDRKARALAREKEAEEKRKQDQEASEAALRKFAQTQMARERARRQQMEALEWAQRRAGMENPRLPENPFDDRSAA
ncbi:hypothetical protein F4823DRAFT_566927 [Ustulina deusta]|nr:hypothetical protein F4823DRAFT_566927 [Ustulina deusta]